MYLGIDIGGTFTDLVLMDDDGALHTTKAPTTPGRLEVGVFEAVSLAAQLKGLKAEELLGRVKAFGHGTTQATNALIERKGALTGLITTRGFGDTLYLQRLMGFTAGLSVEQIGWYSRRRYPEPIVPRHLTREVAERVDQAGKVLVPLDEAAVRKAVGELVAAGVDTFAVALLWSFRNPAHEQRVGEIIREAKPNAFVSLSSDVAPVIGEYERTATAAMNSYLAPKVVDYLDRIEGMLRERGFSGSFNMLNSSGGVIPAKEAMQKPVLLVASGPTGGVMGSLYVAKALGYSNVITTDMGGTSFDVALIVDGKPLTSTSHEAGGFHLATPMVDIRAIGAGGGSIATVERGRLRVGPESAGAEPGPVCYGRGGTRATVTDADLVLGIYSPDNFLGGRMKLDLAGARKAIQEQIADPLGVSLEEAAAGIRRVVDGHMADTLREVTIGRGHDPRDFVLFAYGGAGPAHSAGFGAEAGVSKIIVPITSMAHSAYGALASDITQTSERSLMMASAGGGDRIAGLDAGRIAELFADLKEKCLDAIERAGIARSEAEISYAVEMRYRRQTKNLTVPVPETVVDNKAIAALVARFEGMYEAIYGKGAGFSLAGIELTTFRVTAVGHTQKPKLAESHVGVKGTPTKRRIFEPTLLKSIDTDIWQWHDIAVGQDVVGPAVIEHPETTVYVGPRQTAVIDPVGNLIIDTKGTA